MGPNPFRAHDVIGAAGANFLTSSCLHHLTNNYGGLFEPTTELVEHKESRQNWYPPNHFRPLVNWSLDDKEQDEFLSWIQGPLFQMVSLLLYEKRGHLSHINAISELCAQFQPGVMASMRSAGLDTIIKRVESYQNLHPQATKTCWYPEVFEEMDENLNGSSCMLTPSIMEEQVLLQLGVKVIMAM